MQNVTKKNNTSVSCIDPYVSWNARKNLKMTKTIKYVLILENLTLLVESGWTCGFSIALLCSIAPSDGELNTKLSRCRLIWDGRGRNIDLVNIVSGMWLPRASSETQPGNHLFSFMFGCDKFKLGSQVTMKILAVREHWVVEIDKLLLSACLAGPYRSFNQCFMWIRLFKWELNQYVIKGVPSTRENLSHIAHGFIWSRWVGTYSKQVTPAICIQKRKNCL